MARGVAATSRTAVSSGPIVRHDHTSMRSGTIAIGSTIFCRMKNLIRRGKLVEFLIDSSIHSALGITRYHPTTMLDSATPIK
jgi:hypothetical protein